MLKSLYIHNYAIIDEINIDFSPRMNVITGETGAGKSILMGALSLILGERADTSVLLNREKKCIVEGTFDTQKKEYLNNLLEQLDLETDDTGSELVIRREIAASGKSRAFVNDTPVNLDQLKQVSSQLVDLHKQFDTLTLGDSSFQREVLDALAGNAALLFEYQTAFKNWRQLNDELNELKLRKDSFNKEYDYNKFLFDELEDAAFGENELEEAENELKLLNNAETIRNMLGAAGELLSSGEHAVEQQIRSLTHQLDAYSSFHPKLEEICARLKSAHIELQDVADEVERLGDEVSYDSARVNELNERLSAGYKLFKKHGVKSTSELLLVMQQLGARLQEVLNIDEQIAAREKQLNVLWKAVGELAEKLSAKREKQLKPFEQEVNKLLHQVGMPNARIKVSIEPKAADTTGRDEVEFLFDANRNNRFEPLRKIASGGELSRLMLSIKSLVAQSMDMPTLIFDEIDTGISGEAAKQVGAIMHSLADNRQLITITHQPQIAGRAHAHLFVFKDSRNNVTTTNIRMLSRDERVTAIAKMLSGEKPTAAALENAREMVMN